MTHTKSKIHPKVVELFISYYPAHKAIHLSGHGLISISEWNFWGEFCIEWFDTGKAEFTKSGNRERPLYEMYEMLAD